MGTRKKGEVQEPLWIVSQQVVSAPVPQDTCLPDYYHGLLAR
jgi:hypothetical protein